mgnify:CR=1 FL=1
MYHAVKFARLAANKVSANVAAALYRGEIGKDTWIDWHLIPNERPSFAPPPIKTNFIDIDSSDTSIDLTSSIGGYTPHGRRTGSWEFHVMNNYVRGYDAYKQWTERYSEIMNYLHHQEIIAILEDDPGFFYRGRFFVNQWRSDPDRSKITIEYSAVPFKYEITASDEDWLWDPFSFVTGVIRNTKSIAVNGSKTINIIGSPAPWQPSFKLESLNSETMVIYDQFHEVERTLTSDNVGGSYVFADITLRPLGSDPISASNQDSYGNNIYPFVFTGNGVITVSYRGGSL